MSNLPKQVSRLLFLRFLYFRWHTHATSNKTAQYTVIYAEHETYAGAKSLKIFIAFWAEYG